MVKKISKRTGSCCTNPSPPIKKLYVRFIVIEDFAPCYVAFESENGDLGSKLPVKIVSYDSEKDLALLKLQNKNNTMFSYISIGDSDKLVPGQRVVAIGDPLGLVNTVTDGIISNIRKQGSLTLIQTSAPITHGSSGGALLNMYGELIGITTAGIKGEGNLNFAVSSNDIKSFLGKLPKQSQMLGTDIQQSGSNDSEYILPDSNKRRLLESDIELLSLEELKLARNEIFARHGYVFSTPEIKAYFEKKSWYKENPNYYDGDLNEIERYNINFIKKHEAELIGE